MRLEGTNGDSPWRTGPLEPDADAPLAWLVSLGRPEAEAMMDRAALSGADYAAYAGRADAPSRLARRRLVKAVVSQLTGCHPDTIEIGRSPLGAPLIVRPAGWHLSLAARWPLVALAIAREPVGVDVERLHEPPPPDDAFTAEERGRIASPDDALALWTAKEAHAKRTGRASLYDAAEIETRVEDGLLTAHCAAGASRCWTIRHDAAVATLAVGL